MIKLPQEDTSESLRSGTQVDSASVDIAPFDMDIEPASDTALATTQLPQDDFQEEYAGSSSGTTPYHETPTHELLKTIAGIAGNVLEWYDFAVFGFFSDIIGSVFFPPQAGNAAIVESFAVFGGAFLMRPVGGVIMGYIGDTYGRKKALESSIFLMALPTFCMGLLPSYQQVGWLAIVLLITVRLLQGLSVGGQLVSSLVFTLENHPKSKWGLFGSYVMASANFGTLLGGIVGFTLRSLLSDRQLHIWGWRLPFLSGIFVSLSGIYLKYFCTDEDDHGFHPQHGGGSGEPSNPIRKAFARENRRSLLASTLVPMLWSAGFYLSFVWMAIFMSELVDPPVPAGFFVNSTSLFFSVCLLFPLAGILSDKFGRRRIMTVGGVAMGILGPFMVMIIGRAGPYAAFAAQSTLGIALSFWGAPMCAWLVESFNPASRLTSVAIGYNLAHAIVGGMTPSLATIMVDSFGLDAPGFILTALAASSLVGLLLVAPPKPVENAKEDFSVVAADDMYVPDTEHEIL